MHLPSWLKRPLGGNLSSCSGSAWAAKRSCHLIVSFCTRAARSTCKHREEVAAAGGSHVSRHKTRMTRAHTHTQKEGSLKNWCFSEILLFLFVGGFFVSVCVFFFLPSASESQPATSACTSAAINLMASRQKLLKLAATGRPESSTRDVRCKNILSLLRRDGTRLELKHWNITK